LAMRAANSGARPARNFLASLPISAIDSASRARPRTDMAWLRLSSQRPSSASQQRIPAALLGNQREPGRGCVACDQDPGHLTHRAGYVGTALNQPGQAARRGHPTHHDQVLAGLSVRVAYLRDPARGGLNVTPQRAAWHRLPTRAVYPLSAGPWALLHGRQADERWQ